MNITVTFDPRNHIWEAAAKDDGRPALTCVLIDPSGVLVASDGFMLGVVKADVGKLDKPVVVEAEAFEVAASSQARLVLDMEARTCAVDMKTHTRIWPFFDGTFPRWRPLVPDLNKLTFGIPVGGYDARLTTRAGAVVGGNGVTGGGLGEGQPFVLADTKNNALVIIMPMFFKKSEVMDGLHEAYRNLGIGKAEPVVTPAS